MVNPGSGGKKAPLLLDLKVEEIEFNNYVNNEKSLKGLKTIKVKICALNDANDRNTRLIEIRDRSRNCSSPGRI